jgi:hypothetical protein
LLTEKKKKKKSGNDYSEAGYNSTNHGTKAPNKTSSKLRVTAIAAAYRT